MLASEIVYIYGLIDPRTKELRYIGKSVDPRIRLRKHISERFQHDSYKDRWVRKLIDSESKPILFIIDIVEKSEWVFWEKFYISYFRGLGTRLTNSTNGGDQPPSTKGRKHTKKSREKMSKSKKGKPIPWLNNGEERTKKHRENLSKSLKGRVSNNKGKKFSKEYRKKLSKAHIGLQSGEKHPMYGKHHSEESKKKISKALTLKVIQLSLNNEVIKIWDSIKEAQETLRIGHISTVCKGKRKTSGGFKWKYL
jgi:group I intron endonuclease